MVRYIFFPSIRRSLLVIAVLNFVKSFKEFTLIFMMTAGGPPLISGITERYIVGSTTTLGIFLYDLFNETDDFGIVSAYSIVMAGLVVLVMILWFFLKKPRETGPSSGHLRGSGTALILGLSRSCYFRSSSGRS